MYSYHGLLRLSCVIILSLQVDGAVFPPEFLTKSPRKYLMSYALILNILHHGMIIREIAQTSGC
jgi:hypothetical protein